MVVCFYENKSKYIHAGNKEEILKLNQNKMAFSSERNGSAKSFW